MKNTTAVPVFVKAKSDLGKNKFKSERYRITDVDIYEEEERLKVKKTKKILNSPDALIIKKLVK